MGRTVGWVFRTWSRSCGLRRGVAVVETQDHPDRDQVVAHRIDERSAELAVLRLRAQRPPHRVDHPVERPRDLPHLLHAELPHLGCGVAAQPEAVERDVGEVPVRALREHGHAGDEVTARLEVGQLLVLQATALVAGAHADHATLFDEEVDRRGLGQEHRALGLGAFGEPATELREGDDDVAVVAHRRRRRDRQAAVAGEDVHLLLVDRAVRGHAVEAAVALEQPLQRTGADHRAGQEVRAGLLALLDDRERHVAESLGDVGVLLEQLPEADRAGEAGGSGAHHEHAHLDAFVEQGRSARRRTGRGRARCRSRRDATSARVLAEQLDQLGHDGVHVTHDREVAELEDRRVRVLVHGDDRLRALHADLVLHGTGDPERDVELR